MRTRERNNLSSRVATKIIGYYNAASTTGPEVRSRVGAFESISDVVTPNFKRRISSGEVINNPVKIYRMNISAQDKAAEIKSDRSSPGWNYSLWPLLSGVINNPPDSNLSPLVLDCDLQKLESLAVTSAFAKVGGPDVQSIVSIGEMRQTLDMLRRPLDGIYAVFRGRRWKDWGDLWLQYRYGLIPLIMEVQGLMQALSRVTSERKRETARAFVQNTVSPGSLPTSYTDAQLVLKGTCHRSMVVSVRAGVLYEHELTLADRLGFALTEIPAATWELVPWSFVWDWLVNVGDVISALSPNLNTHALTAWVSTTRITSLNYVVDSFSLTSEATGYGWKIQESCVGATAVGIYSLTERRPVDRTDISLGIRLNLTPKRLLDSLALLLQKKK